MSSNLPENLPEQSAERLSRQVLRVLTESLDEVHGGGVRETREGRANSRSGFEGDWVFVSRRKASARDMECGQFVTRVVDDVVWPGEETREVRSLRIDTRFDGTGEPFVYQCTFDAKVVGAGDHAMLHGGPETPKASADELFEGTAILNRHRHEGRFFPDDVHWTARVDSLLAASGDNPGIAR